MSFLTLTSFELRRWLVSGALNERLFLHLAVSIASEVKGNGNSSEGSDYNFFPRSNSSSLNWC